MVEHSKSSLVLVGYVSNYQMHVGACWRGSIPLSLAIFDKETCRGKISFFEAGKIKKKVIVVRYIWFDSIWSKIVNKS